MLKAIKRKWLLFHIRGWQRDIEFIKRDRAHLFQAEVVLRREILIAQAKLTLEMTR